MERALTSLERKALSNNVGRQEEEFLVCAVSLLGTDHVFIDGFKSCTERDHVPRLKKELKKQFPKDDVRIIINKGRRIE